MSTTLIATLGGLWAMLLWGAAAWLLARSSKKANVFQVNASIQVTGLLVAGSVMFLSHQHMPGLKNALIIGAASLMFSLAFMAYVRAYALGSTGVVAPAASVYPLFTILFSALLVGLAFSFHQILSMLIIIAGVATLAFEKRNPKISLQFQHRATILAIVAAVFWGIGNTIQNTIIHEQTWQIFIGFIDIWMTLFAFIFLFTASPLKFTQRVKDSINDKQSLVAGATFTVGSCGFYYASVRAGSVIIPLVVSSAEPLVTSALARFVDHEKLTIVKRAGAVVIVAGIILLNIQ